MELRKIKSALISVFYKDGLEPLLKQLSDHGVTIYSTGGTQAHIEKLGHEVVPVESLTGYPSILDGRVKTLHPAVFGGILAKREDDHLAQLAKHNLPEIDMVVVDLYPFEETVATSNDESKIIEKIDIGGISLIRAAAKNYRDVVIVPSRNSYASVVEMLKEGNGATTLENRRELALEAFAQSAKYDSAIQKYFLGLTASTSTPGHWSDSHSPAQSLRYGENPHQDGVFYGDLTKQFEQLHGKAISYNNLVDIDSALGLMAEFETARPTVAILKHTNACGVATRDSLVDAWHAALAADNVSAFGGILVFNRPIDLATANEVHKLFCEVVLAPDFDEDAFKLLSKKKNRVLLKVATFARPKHVYKSMLGGVLSQDSDLKVVGESDVELMTTKAPTSAEMKDLLFANICAKHLKSNTIALVKDEQLLAMGCGQTSRVDALKQAIDKAQRFGFQLAGAVMASDAFFPFPDCVEIAGAQGITAVIQPGGSIKDQDSIDKANELGIAMVKTGIRHFKH